MIGVVLRGVVAEGDDGLHHENDCCPGAKTLAGQFPEARWLLPAIPRKGETVELPDEHGAQGVTVLEVVYRVDGVVEVWLGGWVHWSAANVLELFRRVEATVRSASVPAVVAEARRERGG